MRTRLGFMKATRPILVAILVAGVVLPSAAGWAQEERSEVFDRIYARQPIETVARGRSFAQPMVGYVVNDVYLHQLAVGGDLGFHITEAWGVGATFSQYFTQRTPFFGEVQRDYAIFPEDVRNEWSAGGFVTWAPIRGKAAFYPLAVLHMRLYMKVGAGVLHTTTDLHPAGDLGLGIQFLFLRYFALTIELADQMYVETYATRDEFKNQFLVRAGITFLIPVL